MAVSVKVRDDTGDYVDITEHVRLFNHDSTPLLELTENAEEGSVAINRLELDDLSVALSISGHRGVVVGESAIASGETGIFRGYTADRGHVPNEGISAQGRTIAMNVADINSVFDRRILVGGGANRKNPETDVARITWAMAQNEAGLIDSDRWLSSSNPKNMDDADYRKRNLGDVFNDCAQASGKNWGLTYDFSNGDGFQLWYGRDELSVYDSGCTLTNDPSSANDSTVFLIGDETNIWLDPARVYSGIGVEYKKGFVYRQSSSTAAAFARRDALMQAPHCKTKARAIERAEGYLSRHATEELRIETYIYVSAANANKIRPFHRVQFQSTMSQLTTSPIYCRVLRRTMTYWKPGVWRVALTLIAIGEPEPLPAGLVQFKVGTNMLTSIGSLTFDEPCGAGDTIIIWACARGGQTGSSNAGDGPGGSNTTGWTELTGSPQYNGESGTLVVWTKTAVGGETEIQLDANTTGHATHVAIAEVTGSIAQILTGSGSSGSGGVMNWTTGTFDDTNALVIAAINITADDLSHDYAGAATTPGAVELDDGTLQDAFSPGWWFGYAEDVDELAGTWNHHPQSYVSIGIAVD